MTAPVPSVVAITAAALVDVTAFAIGWHYLVRPFFPPPRVFMSSLFRRSSLCVALLLLAAPLSAQTSTATSYPTECSASRLKSAAIADTTRKRCAFDRAHVDAVRAAAAVKTATATATKAQTKLSLAVRAESLARASYAIALNPPAPTPTPIPPKDSVVVVQPQPQPDTIPAPIPPPPPVQPTSTVGPAAVAALPFAEPVAPYPTPTRIVRITASADLQAAINAASCGDELRLAMGGVWKASLTIPAKTCAAGWLAARADTTDAALAGRMTPTKAAALRLPRIEAPNDVSAVTVAFGANHVILDGLEVTTAAGVPINNVLVKLGDGASNGMRTRAQVPHDLVIRHSWIHGTPTLATKRCILVNSSETAIVENWLADCHSNQNDAQCIAGFNGTRTVLLLDNHCEASHEVIAFGGDDPADSSMAARDITIRGNHVTRPVAWKGVWRVKNLLETKHVRRLLVEGNLFENNWADAQVGFAFVLKSENPGNSPWAESSDITIRNNLIRNTGACFNLSGSGSNGLQTITAARITITGNVCTNVNVAPFLADEYPVQFLAGVSDVILAHNTIENARAKGAAQFGDQWGPVRLAMHSNFIAAGQYAVHGGNCNGGACLAKYAPGSLFLNNVIVGGGIYPLACDYGATTLCPATLPASLPLGFDGRAVGADTAAVAAAARTAEVLP